MSPTTIKTILGENAIITPEQERVLADFEIVRSLELFPQQMWSSVDEFEICRFGTWCRQVLTVDYFDFFKVKAIMILFARLVHSSFDFVTYLIVYLF